MIDRARLRLTSSSRASAARSFFSRRKKRLKTANRPRRLAGQRECCDTGAGARQRCHLRSRPHSTMRTRSSPGSEMPGVPASVISATCCVLRCILSVSVHTLFRFYCIRDSSSSACECQNDSAGGCCCCVSSAAIRSDLLQGAQHTHR